MNTPNSFTSVYNFIVNFAPNEIDEVIADFETRNRGVKTLFAIDPYDVIAHYLPYTEDSFFRNSNKNILAQKLICYDHFFDFPKRHVVILDEYTIELLSVKNRIQRQLQDSSLIINNLEDLKKSTAQFTASDPKANEFLEKNFELILLLLILNEKKDFIHEEFDDFLKNKLTLINIETGSQDDDEVINKIFSSTLHSSLSQKLFKAFVNDTKIELLEYSNPEERYIYLENTFRDIQAIDRILLINERFQAGVSYVLVYLSSTPKKTAKIFKSLKKLVQEDPSLQKERIDIHRNIFQCFLLDVLESEFKEDSVGIRSALKSLKKLAIKFAKNEKKQESGQVDFDLSDEPILTRLKGIFDFYSSKLDNHFYIKIYEKYKSLCQEFQPSSRHNLSVKKVPQSNIDVLEIFTLIDNFLHQENFKRKLFNIPNTLSQLQQALDITNILMSPNVNFGNDVIKNNFHHLPYLVFYKIDKSLPLIEKLHGFLNKLVDISNPKHSFVKELSAFIRPVISELTDDIRKIDLLSLQQIVISYINLVTLPASGRDISEKEMEIIESLEKQKAIFGSVDLDRTISFDNNRTNLNVSFKENIYSREIDYILLWLYRRNNRISDGISLGRELVQSYPDDPRFYHGLGLCYISCAYTTIFRVDISQEEQTRTIENLDASILYLTQAKDLYEILMTANNDMLITTLIRKNYIAVLNSLSDVFIRKYVLTTDKQYSYIAEARTYFEALKLSCQMIDFSFGESDTFVGTELEILYYEAFDAFLKRNISDAHKKIIVAQVWSSSLDRMKSDSVTHPMFRTIQTLMNELFSKINNEMSNKRIS